MNVFDVYYKNKLGPGEFEAIYASTEEEALDIFKKRHPLKSVIKVQLSNLGRRG